MEEAFRRVQGYFVRLTSAFGWRYVAIVGLVYGLGQGLAEALLFNSEKYYLLDDKGLSAARYTQIDGFSNIPWQVKALYGMLSDTFPLCGLRRTPYMVLASVVGVVSGVTLAAKSFGATVAALFLVLANLSIAMPDVMIDASAAERAKTHPELASDVQTLMHGSLHFLAFFGEIAVGFLVSPKVIGSRGVFLVFAFTGLLGVFVPAALGWLGEQKVTKKRPTRQHYRKLALEKQNSKREQRLNPIAQAFQCEDDDDDVVELSDHHAGGGNNNNNAAKDDDDDDEEDLSSSASSELSRRARGPIFLAALATTAVSLAIGLLQLLYGDALVEGVATVVLGAALAALLYKLLRPISVALAGSAVYIFLEGALQPSTGVIFQWSHDDGLKNGNCHCDDSDADSEDDDCGWAKERGYPCVAPETYGFARATARLFGLLGVVWYNAYFSRWRYRRIFTLGTTVSFFSNLLDLAWVSRLNLKLGVNDDVFLFGAEMIQPVLRKLQWMPIFVLAAKLCPEKIEATLFALLMSLSNFGAVVGTYNGVALLHIFGGVDAPDFHHITSFVFVRTLFYLAPLLLIPLFVPNGGPRDDDDEDPLLLLEKTTADKPPQGGLELVAIQPGGPIDDVTLSYNDKDEETGKEESDESPRRTTSRRGLRDNKGKEDPLDQEEEEVEEEEACV